MWAWKRPPKLRLRWAALDLGKTPTNQCLKKSITSSRKNTKIAPFAAVCSGRPVRGSPPARENQISEISLSEKLQGCLFWSLFLWFHPCLNLWVCFFFFFVSRLSHCMCEGWSCCGQHNTRLVGIWWHIWHNFRVWLAHQVFLPQTIPMFHPLAKFPYNASQIAAAVGGGLCVIIFKMRQKI